LREGGRVIVLSVVVVYKDESLAKEKREREKTHQGLKTCHVSSPVLVLIIVILLLLLLILVVVTIVVVLIGLRCCGS
jgi:hypothetical protein